MSKIGLVLEGGSMRGMFTSGVLDTFLDEGIEVDGIIGVSAGTLFGPNYYSKQRGRVVRYNKRFCKNPRYMSIVSLLLTGNIVNKKFAYYDVTTKYDIFDNETFMKNNKGFYATVTNIETGKAEYLEVKDILKDMEILRASSAMPCFSEIIEVNGKKYLDGGIADSIPIDKCKDMGYDKIIVVLTRSVEYRKEPLSDLFLKVFSSKYKKYPNFIETMKNRYIQYNETIQRIIDMENKKEIFVIRPSVPITLRTIERNPKNLQLVYDLGIKDSKKVIGKLKEYLNQENTR